mmetsp:Transcript_34087/g.80882  ORF Transcript_34087/g.80882 Transcript_34087/m.80882 type:complete len:238 (+) Transcript_34087:203-916(+)
MTCWYICSPDCFSYWATRSSRYLLSCRSCPISRRRFFTALMAVTMIVALSVLGLSPGSTSNLASSANLSFSLVRLAFSLQALLAAASKAPSSFAEPAPRGALELEAPPPACSASSRPLFRPQLEVPAWLVSGRSSKRLCFTYSSRSSRLRSAASWVASTAALSGSSSPKTSNCSEKSKSPNAAASQGKFSRSDRGKDAWRKSDIAAFPLQVLVEAKFKYLKLNTTKKFTKEIFLSAS